MNSKGIMPIALIFVVFSSCTNKTFFENDLSKLKLHAAIKRIQKNAYEVEMKFGEIEKTNPISKITIEPFYDDFFRDLYFDQGNWIERIEFQGNGQYKTLKILTERIIEYY
jgi:hypothetical protein